jgi:hypothetical protein
VLSAASGVDIGTKAAPAVMTFVGQISVDDVVAAHRS